MPDDLEITAYRGIWCRGCGNALDPHGYCPRCEPEATDEEITAFVDAPQADRLFRVQIGVGRVLVLARDSKQAAAFAREAAVEYVGEDDAYSVAITVIELPTRGESQVLDVDWS